MTKQEIRIRIDELQKLITNTNQYSEIIQEVHHKITEYKNNLKTALDDTDMNFIDEVLESHRVICDIKQMPYDHAFGAEPSLYYGAAVAAESGELLNKLIKTIRHHGMDREKLKEAVESEIADVMIYSVILALTTRIDLIETVKKKTKIVIERAMSGYYGGSIKKD